MASFCDLPLGTANLLLLVPTLAFTAVAGSFMVSFEDAVDDKSSRLKAAKSTMESRANNPRDILLRKCLGKIES